MRSTSWYFLGKKCQQDEENIKKLLGCMKPYKTFAQRRCRFIATIVALKSHVIQIP